MITFYYIHKKLTWALTVGLLAALTVAGFALADNVVNNLDNTVDPALESTTITAGGSVTVGFYIDPTTGGGDASGCNATGKEPAYLRITPPSGVTVFWTGYPDNPIEFVGCGSDNLRYATFSSNTPGSYTITGFSMTGGKSDSQWNTATAKFTLIVEAAAPSDTTPPVITPSISGTLGSNDWYVSDVTVRWTVTDDESEVTILEGCEDTTIDNDTDGVTLICRASSAGGTSQASVTIQRDATPPTASASASPAPNANGWNNTNVTVSFSGEDDLSGIDFCSADVVLSGEGAGQSASGTCTDKAGNVSDPATASGINIDKTAPTITWSNGPADGGVYYYGFVPAEPTCEADDKLSGPDVCTVWGYGNAIGSHTMTAAAKDKAGNETVETRKYTVLAWTLLGFYQPVDMGGVYNVVKNGSTVPLKFEIFAGSTELTEVSAVKSLNLVQVTCNPGTLTDEIEITATGGTVLRYDFTAGQFIYNWQTPKNNIGKCYRVTMTTQDGSSLAAYFKLK